MGRGDTKKIHFDQNIFYQDITEFSTYLPNVPENKFYNEVCISVYERTVSNILLVKVPYCAVAMVEEVINEEDELFGHTSPTPSR